MTDQQQIEKAAQIIIDHCKVQRFSDPVLKSGPLDVARALADAGMLTDPIAEGHMAQRILDLRDERDELRVAMCKHNKCPGGSLCCCPSSALTALQRVRELHRPHECTGFPECMAPFGGECAYEGACDQCRRSWPCPTIAILDDKGVADA